MAIHGDKSQQERDHVLNGIYFYSRSYFVLALRHSLTSLLFQNSVLERQISL